MDYYKILRPLIYCFPPETAHNMAISVLKSNVFPKQSVNSPDILKLNIFGLRFDNPVGMAAGFDKNGDAIEGLFGQGFGFVEVGTVTPKPQDGNAKPRLFRLVEDEAVINRFGFNNKGADHFVNNLKNAKKSGILGANIGKNKTSQSAVDDYLFMMDKVYGLSDYITINISSPNTPGLCDLQQKDELDGFLSAILNAKLKLKEKTGADIPILLKLAPDTDPKQREDIAQIVIRQKIDGLIISNTTIGGRDILKSAHANETGGLSGRPLFDMSTQMVSHMYKLTEGKIPIIGVGGISSAEEAYKKIRAGASLVQIYSALVFKGFKLVKDINTGLEELLKKDGFSNVSDAIGKDCI
ncbi:MAG: dihydroorotate dehydrogenase (quinone) [Alphaproteobacteria bacterium CG11_big_fil_rev_8_21_14_0_20_39_49]|nr:MAG: dihydroorotate dehydrogenase (quinone) [Alphaproteobacteria bacterium CG11_big_fil_rev_8_21_14_0_20_39_49]